MTFLEIQGVVARRLAAQGMAAFDAADIQTAINAGYAELSDASEWCERFLTIDLLNNRPYYDLQTLIGPTFLSLKPAFHADTNRWLMPTPVRQLDAGDNRWERVTGVPQRMMLRGWRWFGLYPRTQADGGTLKVYYTALPAPLIADADEPGFPETFQDALIDFACADLWAQDAETQWALAAELKYLTGEQALSRWVQERVRDPWVRGMGIGR